jgi:hypothetical protein
MIKNFKDIVVLLITTGVLILLATIIIGDYIVAEENRPSMKYNLMKCVLVYGMAVIWRK